MQVRLVTTLPISPYFSLFLPTSPSHLPHISPTSPHISPHLPTSPKARFSIEESLKALAEGKCVVIGLTLTLTLTLTP